MPETKLESRTPRAADTAQPQPKSHGLALKDRRHLAVTGVIRVISCDENAAVLETPLGNLTVGGQELQIGELSTQSGQVQLIHTGEHHIHHQQVRPVFRCLFQSLAPIPCQLYGKVPTLSSEDFSCIIGVKMKK